MGEHDGHRQRLLDKYRERGLARLCEEEILEVFLYMAIPRKDTHPIAVRLLEKFGSLVGVLDATSKELKEVIGIGDKAATFLTFMKELLFYYRKDKRRYFRKCVDYVYDVAEYLQDTYGNETVEYVFSIYIDEKDRYRSMDVLTKNRPFSAELDFVYIEKRARQFGCTKVIIAHNHPSGLAIPSLSDIAATDMARSYLESMGMQLVDHIIFERDDFVSLAESEMLDHIFLSEEFYEDFLKKKYDIEDTENVMGKLPPAKSDDKKKSVRKKSEKSKK